MSTDLADPKRGRPAYIPSQNDSFIDLTGIADLPRLARLPVDLVLQGETGSGKDTVAREIHRRHSPAQAFVTVNCAAIPEALMESELFGVEAGAYTGAVRARGGKIEAADRGVLYLDEIDSMNLHLQAKLLHVLQYRGSVRLGGNLFRRSSFRLIASTKVALKSMVDRGQFRSDLYYRLNTVTIQLPPLRAQTPRILPTLHRMLHAHSQHLGQQIAPLEAADEATLLAHHWPGNYRELLSCAIRHLCGQKLLADHEVSQARPDAEAAPAEVRSQSLKDRIMAFERKIITLALDASEGNVARAADQLKMSPQTLHYRIRALKLRHAT
ncbi:transcriptional regulator with PAS, ATPase and Fis domain [Variovorax boronicumulans]|uniref:sigma 54-interacting transcriptional regulator n=1 Tax=Variovorax boronicumulans TaxID=436515 RepID=UPI002783549F|nr:sigma 54-interacting transcriptional regulator [Variovorax boronicumulans]MDQ0083823.1 transcriptional regulator with PAS, ATPase and Fis domain [Variovorax boronicumulans]